MDVNLMDIRKTCRSTAGFSSCSFCTPRGLLSNISPRVFMASVDNSPLLVIIASPA